MFVIANHTRYTHVWNEKQQQKQKEKNNDRTPWTKKMWNVIIICNGNHLKHMTTWKSSYERSKRLIELYISAVCIEQFLFIFVFKFNNKHRQMTMWTRWTIRLFSLSQTFYLNWLCSCMWLLLMLSLYTTQYSHNIYRTQWLLVCMVFVMIVTVVSWQRFELIVNLFFVHIFLLYIS